jgi:hypothetical protein
MKERAKQTPFQDSIVSDEICQIKRHKGRGRYEVFIHNPEFRLKMETLDIHIYTEQGELKPFFRKFLCKHYAYACLLRDFLRAVSQSSLDNEALQLTSQFNESIKGFLPMEDDGEGTLGKQLAAMRQALDLRGL